MNKRLRIAMLLNCFPAVSETFILRQVTGLIDLGHDVDIFAESRPENGGPIHPEVAKYGLLARTTYIDMPAEAGYWELPVWPLTERTWAPGAETSTLNAVRALQAGPALARSLMAAPRLTLQVLSPSQYGYQAQSLSALYRLAALASRRRSYDVLHAHYGPVGKSFRFARHLWNAPLVVTFHGFDFSTWPRKEGPGVYESLFDVVDLITVNCEYTRKRVEELGCAPEKIENLHVGLVIDDFPFRERTRRPGEPVRILSVGRLVEKKGLEYSIRAVAQVRAQFPELRYDIIGDGPLKSDLDQLVHELGMDGVVVLHGAQNSACVRRSMAEADIFMLASVTAADGDQEGTPVSLMEAQASGLPILSSWHSGIPEVVLDGRTGFLAPERDVAVLTERLLFLVKHSESWPVLGRAGRKCIEEQFSLADLNRRLAELYKQSIGAYRGAAKRQ